jgi:hypothetical protein
MKGDEWMRPANKWLERTMLGVTSLAGASAAPLARRSATPLGRTEGLDTYNAIRYNITRDTLIS